MNSLAIWCKKKIKEDDIPAEIHFNFWKLPCSERKKYKLFKEYEYEYFLDIGLKVGNTSNAEEIKVFLPFKISKDELVDLGEILINDAKLINGIFNEDYSITTDTTPKQVKVNRPGDDTKFIVYSLDKENIIVEYKYEGSVITLKYPNIDLGSCNTCYFRFRIKTNTLETLTRKYDSKNSFFENAFTMTEVIDFRLNEKRSYNGSMAESIKKDGEFRIEKVHFLLLLDGKEDLISNGNSTFTCRELEKNIWKSYIDSKYDKRNIIAYHWRQKIKDIEKSIESFNSLIKIKFSETNSSTIFKYIAVLVTMTIFINIFSAGATWVINKGITKATMYFQEVVRVNK